MPEKQERWAAVEHYYERLLVKPDAVLDGVLEESARAGLPAIAVSAAQGKFLGLLVRMIGAKKVLEIGTLAGYSAIWMGRALAEGKTGGAGGADGKLISLEMDPRHAEIAKKNLAKAGLQDVVDVRIGRAIENLPKLQAENAGPFDLIFIDADKASTADYFIWALALTHPGSVIVVDNVVRNGEIVNEKSTDEGVAGIRRFNELAAKEKRVSGTVLQTVSGKGYDGLAIVLVEA